MVLQQKYRGIFEYISFLKGFQGKVNENHDEKILASLDKKLQWAEKIDQWILIRQMFALTQEMISLAPGY